MDNQEIYNRWLTEQFLVEESERTLEDEEKLVRLYDLLQELKDWDEEIGLE